MRSQPDKRKSTKGRKCNESFPWLGRDCWVAMNGFILLVVGCYAVVRRIDIRRARDCLRSFSGVKRGEKETSLRLDSWIDRYSEYIVSVVVWARAMRPV